MRLRRLWLVDFRSYESLDVALPEGLCVVRGPNGVGKSNLLEAIGWLAGLTSFRGAPTDAMVRDGATRAIVRGELSGDDGRIHLVEAEINPGGRHRVLVDRQRLRRARDLLGTVRTTVFSPDDLSLVKGGPSGRREYLDDLLVSLHPRNDELRSEWERCLRQRNALLKQVGGRLDESGEVTLDVWNSKAATAGGGLAGLRTQLVERLGPSVRTAYRELSRSDVDVALQYAPSWSGDLRAALEAARDDDLRRGVTTVGPHRDELQVMLDGRPARTHASQGEQRCLALALRLAGHREVLREVGRSPLLLLDDVFSELDPQRCDALVGALPPGQAVLTTAGALPGSVHPDAVLDAVPGGLRPVAAVAD